MSCGSLIRIHGDLPYPSRSVLSLGIYGEFSVSYRIALVAPVFSSLEDVVLGLLGQGDCPFLVFFKVHIYLPSTFLNLLLFVCRVVRILSIYGEFSTALHLF